ncbi:MAG: hypothetical protein ACNYNX_08565 [Leucobacter sp.]
MRVTRTVRVALAGALILGIIGVPLAAPPPASAVAEASQVLRNQVLPNEVVPNEVEPGEGVAGIIAGAAGALILLGVGSFVARRRIS